MFVAVANSGVGNGVMTTGNMAHDSSSHQGLPSAGYSTGLSGGWQHSWGPWVNPTADLPREQNWEVIDRSEGSKAHTKNRKDCPLIGGFQHF